jgi:hypothetical protein
MIFFTRKLHDGIQARFPKDRDSMREWERRAPIYRDYLKAITPMLDEGVVRLAHSGLHDAVVTEVKRRRDRLEFTLDPLNKRKRAVKLVFHHVKVTGALRGLKGQWWLYEEAHLAPADRFAVHVMFDRSELVIEASCLSLPMTRAPRRSGSKAR